MKYKILIPVLTAFMLIGCEKEEVPMMDYYESEVEEGYNEDGNSEQGPYVQINSVTPVDYCDNTNAAYGVEFELSGPTFSYYYQNQSYNGLYIIVRKGSPSGPIALQKFDAFCAGGTALRTTISDFNCYSVGPMSTLAKNETYYIKAYSGNLDSGWHQFTTPNTSPCAL